MSETSQRPAATPDDPYDLLRSERSESDCLRRLLFERYSCATIEAVLVEHYLLALNCDHQQKLDQAVCACCAVDLGWHSSVADAVVSWVRHVSACLSKQQPSKPGAAA